jgi:hypothetical protein
MLPPDVVVSKVMVTLPVPELSAFVIGGTSLAGDSVAVNVGFVGAVLDGEVEDPQPAATNASATIRPEKRFI